MTDTAKREETAGWISTLVTLVVALVMGAIAVYAAWKSGKEVARLRHEKDVEEENRREAELHSATQGLQEERLLALRKAAEHRARVDQLNGQIAVVEAQRQSRLAQIDQITSWESFKLKREYVTPTPPANPYDDSVDNSSS